MKQQWWALEPLVEQTAHVRGDLIEIGVFRGRMFLCLAAVAESRGVTAWACDTWEGMPQPTELDWVPDPAGTLCRCDYPRNAMTADRHAFEEVVAEYATWGKVAGHTPIPPTVRIVQGVAPECLHDLTDCDFAFAHLDVDQYAPTLACLRWLWPRMSRGGILACHDWMPERVPYRLATAGIAEWMDETGVPMTGVERRTRTAWFVKGWRHETARPLAAQVAGKALSGPQEAGSPSDPGNRTPAMAVAWP